MAGLTIGLVGVSAAFVARAVTHGRAVPVLWVVAICAALVVFLGNPRPFGQVMVWAMAAAAIWFLEKRGAKPAILCSGVAGFLIGSAAPYLALALGDGFPTVPGLAVVLVALVAVGTGLALAGAAGGAMGVLAAALSLGQFALPETALIVIAGAWLSLILSRQSDGAAAALLLFLPFVGFLEGLR